MNFKKKFKAYFTFSRSEKRGILVLIVIIFILISIRIYMNFKNTPKEVDINSVADIIKKIDDSEHISIDSIITGKNYNSAKIKKDTIKKFQNKTYNSNQNNHFPSKYELNSVDSSELIKIAGIGPVLSKRIIKYRNVLGGFYHVEQLKEVYGINEQRYISINAFFQVDTTKICRINLNNCTLFDLEKHPYISDFEAKAIIQFRKFKGNIENIIELKINRLIPDTSFNKLVHYLTVN